MIHQQAYQSAQGRSHGLYLLGCCTVGPFLGLLCLIGIWVRPAVLILTTTALFVLSWSFDLGTFLTVIKYFLAAITVLSLLIRYGGTKVFD